MNPAIATALGAAALFGASTPLAKLLLGDVGPWMLAGLLYLGSGGGLSVVALLRRHDGGGMAKGDGPWLAGAILSGGVVGPVLLMWGLSAGSGAASASLLLNAEGVFTALLAWFAFHENFDRRIALGMAAIIAGAVVLSWTGAESLSAARPALAVLGACLCWAIDNNLTQRLSLRDPIAIVQIKASGAALGNLLLAATLGDGHVPEPPILVGALLLGVFSYGTSILLDVYALRLVGAAREAAYFATAPFFGAIVAVPLLGERIGIQEAVAAVLMALGVGLLLRERHEHHHVHRPLVHEHVHAHDEHHQHAHDHQVGPDEVHAHRHEHAPLEHSHPHVSDAHHRHPH